MLRSLFQVVPRDVRTPAERMEAYRDLLMPGLLMGMQDRGLDADMRIEPQSGNLIVRRVVTTYLDEQVIASPPDLDSGTWRQIAERMKAWLSRFPIKETT
jgi:hypothetical protein